MCGSSMPLPPTVPAPAPAAEDAWGNCGPSDPFSQSTERDAYLSKLERRLARAGALPPCRVPARDLADADNPIGMRVLAGDLQRAISSSSSPGRHVREATAADSPLIVAHSGCDEEDEVVSAALLAPVCAHDEAEALCSMYSQLDSLQPHAHSSDSEGSQLQPVPAPFPPHKAWHWVALDALRAACSCLHLWPGTWRGCMR